MIFDGQIVRDLDLIDNIKTKFQKLFRLEYVNYNPQFPNFCLTCETEPCKPNSFVDQKKRIIVRDLEKNELCIQQAKWIEEEQTEQELTVPWCFYDDSFSATQYQNNKNQKKTFVKELSAFH